MHQPWYTLAEVDRLELFNLGRRLMKIGEEAVHEAGFHPLPTSVRSIMVDAFEHPDSSVSEITTRTGFPQSHASASIARLRDAGVLVTAIDSTDPDQVAEIVTRLEELARLLGTHRRPPAEP